jgi:hypothetical protein
MEEIEQIPIMVIASQTECSGHWRQGLRANLKKEVARIYFDQWQQNHFPSLYVEYQTCRLSPNPPEEYQIVFINASHHQFSTSVTTVLNRWGDVPSRIYLHEGDPIDVRTFVASKESRNRTITEYHHEHDDEIWKCLVEEIFPRLNPDPKALREGIEELIRIGDRVASEQRKKKTIWDITTLKHRIAHRFLSIDVDLQGILTTLDEGEKKAKKYFAEVLWGEEGTSPKDSGYYVGKLEEVRRLAGLEGNEPDTIQKIVQDQNLQDNEWWNCVKKLLGDTGKRDSPLYPLFESLDDLLKDGTDSLDDNKMRLFTEYFADLKKCCTVKDVKWHFDECFEKLIGRKGKYSFHDWFTALDEALDKLRGDLPT